MVSLFRITNDSPDTKAYSGLREFRQRELPKLKGSPAASRQKHLYHLTDSVSQLWRSRWPFDEDSSSDQPEAGADTILVDSVDSSVAVRCAIHAGPLSEITTRRGLVCYGCTSTKGTMGTPFIT